MVRKDPLNERGPAPPGGRPVKKEKFVPQTLFELRPVQEYEDIWEAAVQGTQFGIDTLLRFTQLGFPVEAIPTDLEHLRDELNKIIKIQEARK